LHNIIIISSDAEMNENQLLFYIMYEALFDDSAFFKMQQTLKKCKILNLDMKTVNQRIHNIFEMKHANRSALREEVQHLCAEITRNKKLIDKLETEVCELKYQYQCQICYIILS
ncbi:hypothetical protein EMCG_04021, partial [[Emmonsia] crescens]